MRVKIFGARGSIPTPMLLEDYQSKIKEVLSLYSKAEDKDINNFLKTLPFDLLHTYGGNTSCLLLEDDSVSDVIIIDAGSGIRELGKKLASMNNLNIHIFLSHFHWDHICGIPFFKPLYNPTNRVIFYSLNKNLFENLSRQQYHAHFPMPFEALPAKKEFVILDEKKEFNICGFLIRCASLNHPGGSTAFVFTKNDKKISYVSDTEFTPENIEEKRMYYKACFESSDLLFIDSQYSLIEFFGKFDWGHTATTVAVNLALEWRVKKLVLYHFDPEHKDKDLIKLLNEAKSIQSQFNMRKLEIVQAIEGTYIEV